MLLRSRLSVDPGASLLALPAGWVLPLLLSLAAFNIFSLYLIFDSSINMFLGVFLLGLSCMGFSVLLGLD